MPRGETRRRARRNRRQDSDPDEALLVLAIATSLGGVASTAADLRGHANASLLLSAGAPLLYVSAQLGHANSTITLKTYAEWMPKTDARAHSAMLDDTRQVA